MLSFYVMIYMVIYMQNSFDSELQYRLYRSVREILHPTISKKNISDYKIIVNEEILPVIVFYPKKVTDLEKVIIYIHGDGKVTGCCCEYSKISKELALKTNSLVIAVDYKEKKKKYKEMYQEIYETVKYLYRELERNSIDTSKIILLGDSTGCNIITGINYLNNKEINIEKEILFYPTLSLEYFGNTSFKSLQEDHIDSGLVDKLAKYYTNIAYKKDLGDKLFNPLKLDDYDNVPKTLIFVGKVDLLVDEIKEYSKKIKDCKYIELPFLEHGFLKKIDEEVELEVYSEVKLFFK